MSDINITNNFNAPIGQHIDHVDTVNLQMDGNGKFHFGMVETSYENENTEQARADESSLSVCRAEGVSTEGQNQNEKLKVKVDRVIDYNVLKKAVVKVQPYMWASSAYAVVYCVCRDKYGYPDNMSQFEREFSKSKTGYSCKEGVISSTFRTNSYMKMHIDRWEQNGAKERALILKNKFIEEVNNIIQE